MLFCGSFLLFVFRIILYCLFLAALWSSAGKGLSSWLSCMWRFLVFYVTSPYCGWVRCGIGLYGFLVFAFVLTLMAMTFHKCFMARLWYVINYFISLLIHIFNYSVPLCSYILEGLLCSWLGTLNILNCLHNSVYYTVHLSSVWILALVKNLSSKCCLEANNVSMEHRFQ